MVPSEKNTEVSHNSGERQDNSIASALGGDDLARLEAMFAEDSEASEPEKLTGPESTSPIADSKVHLAETALAGANDKAETVGAIQPSASQPEVRPTQNRTVRSRHARDLHNSILKLTAELEHTRRNSATKPAPAAKSVISPTAPSNPPKSAVDTPHSAFDKKEAAELWGVNDKISSDDVPEGEMTWEQYIAQRPKAKEGDISHSTDKNGNKIYYEATTGHRVKGQDYLNQATYDRGAAQDHYDEVSDERVKNEAHEEAFVENEKRDEKVSGVLRANTEGEILVQKDERLKSLDILGKELLDLRNSNVSKDQYETELKPVLGAKAQAFKALLDAYETQGVDASGLHFIKDTYLEPYENYDHIQYKGSAHHDGEKVDVKDVIVSPAGDKAYVIEGEDGKQKTVQANNVEFKQEFDVPEKKKPGFLERLKKGVKKQVADFREFGLGAYLGSKWNDGKDWLFNRHTEGLEGEELQKQKEKNRLNNFLGGAAILAGTAVAVWAGFQIHDALTPDAAATLGGAPSGSGGGEAGNWTDMRLDQLHGDGSLYGAPSGGGVENLPLDGGTNVVDIANSGTPSPEQLAQAIQNPVYEIPHGGRGLDLFRDLRLSSDTWYAHAGELVAKFPNDFRVVGNDVQIAHSGWLSPEARTYIEGLRG